MMIQSGLSHAHLTFSCNLETELASLMFVPYQLENDGYLWRNLIT